MDPKAKEKFVEVLKQEYDRIFKYGSRKMTVDFGKINKYLGMTIDYTTKILGNNTMSDYTNKIL